MENKMTFFLFKDNQLKPYHPSPNETKTFLNETESVITVFSRDNNDIVIRVPDDLTFDTKVEIAKAIINEDKNFHILSMLDNRESSSELVEAMLDRNIAVINKYDRHLTFDRDDHESISKGKTLPQKNPELLSILL